MTSYDLSCTIVLVVLIIAVAVVRYKRYSTIAAKGIKEVEQEQEKFWTRDNPALSRGDDNED